MAGGMSVGLPGGIRAAPESMTVAEALDHARKAENREDFFDFFAAGAEDCLDDVMDEYIRLVRRGVF